MSLDDKIDIDIAISILNIVSSDVQQNIAPYLRRNKFHTPIVGDPFIAKPGVYEVPLFYVVQGSRHVVERYLLDDSLNILYPSPENESAKVIAAKLRDVPEVKDGA